MVRVLIALVAGVSMVAAVCGCGSGSPQGRKAVSGKVTLDGVPIQQGSIQFQPTEKGGMVAGAMITDGAYKIPADKGPAAGKYKVVISAPEGGSTGLGPDGMPGAAPPKPPKDLVPANFNSQTTLTETVGDKSSYEFNYELKSK